MPRSTRPGAYAHSMRNLHIIHMIVGLDHEPYHPYDPGVRYLCIGTCFPTPEKSTRDPEKVTCKNCLRELKKLE